jgi:hypothetical protein
MNDRYFFAIRVKNCGCPTAEEKHVAIYHMVRAGPSKGQSLACDFSRLSLVISSAQPTWCPRGALA